MEPDSQSYYTTSKTQSFVINDDKIDLLIERILGCLGLQAWEISLSLVSGDEIRTLNRDYRSKDSETDVLAFPQEEWPVPHTCPSPESFKKIENNDTAPPQLLGDVVICLEVAASNARDIGQNLDRELAFLLIHGILHLCGHDHIAPEDEELMTRQQRLIIKKLEDDEPPPVWHHCVRSQV